MRRVTFENSHNSARRVWPRRLQCVCSPLTGCVSVVPLLHTPYPGSVCVSGMSYCKQEGKDRVIFVTEEDHNGPAEVSLPEDDEAPAGLILPDGEINWACPCLGGMATGPCGVEFREAFSCFHYSTADTKGSDCLEPFKQMSECMAQYPNVYGDKDKEEEIAATATDLPNGSQPSDEVTAKA
ncbi:hypothetical protein O3P69_000854 [Scylla paramamosain]|uniref:CHCH domain-containing protein n=2 Tax=Scylla TaxID=6760 RepID=A0AAW0UTK4_SCYPA